MHLYKKFIVLVPTYLLKTTKVVSQHNKAKHYRPFGAGLAYGSPVLAALGIRAMFKKHKNDPDWDLRKLTDEQLESLPLQELQRIRNKRWAHGLEELKERADSELKRRDPKVNWQCTRCGREKFHQKEIRVSGGFGESFLGWERNKYHAIICNYCGKTEFYSVLMSGAEQSIGF